jgi:hypothetical protein
MSEKFFDLATPRDMLRKAMREHERLKRDLSIDNVFNFFVTAYHIQDYVRQTGAAPKDTIKQLVENDEDIHMCHFICLKGKHLKLERNKEKMPDRPTELRRSPASVFGKAVFGKSVFNGGASVNFYVDGTEIDVRGLA